MIGAACAAALGAAASINVQIAVGLVILATLVLIVLRSPVAILPILVATVFIEMIDIGGVRITRLIAPAALLVVLAVVAKRGLDLRVRPPLIWVGAYALWALASGLWTVSSFGTVYLLASLAICLVYMAAFGILLSSRRELELILYTIAVCSFLVSVSSILAFLDKPVGPFGATLQEGRVQGGTGDPSFFAAVQLIALPLILVFATEARGWLRAGLFLTVLMNIASVFSTVSRGGFLQLLAVVLLLLIFPARRIFRSRTQKAAAMLIVVLGGMAFFVRYSTDIAPRLSTILGQSGGSGETASGRLIIWPAAWDAFEERPLTGIGYGAFVETSIDRMYETENTFVGDFRIHPEQVHNTFLGALSELGVAGLLLFTGMLAATARELWRIARTARRAGQQFIERIAGALIVGLVAWCVGAFFISAETSRPIWIVIGISLALPKLVASYERQSMPEAEAKNAA